MTAAPEIGRGSDASTDEVRSYVGELLERPAFAASPRRKKLLAYLVEQALAGRGHRLKAFDIAVAVLGRDERFDPQTDPIVRLEARRLRRDLEHYYRTAGASDPIRVDVPKGGYLPTFSVAAARAPPTPPPAAVSAHVPRMRRRAVLAALALLAAVGAAVAVPALRLLAPAVGPSDQVGQERGPSLVVMPFQALGSEESARLLATGLTSELVSRLMRIAELRVYSGGTASAASRAAPTPPAALRIEGTVQRDAARIRVSARLVEWATGEVLWGETFDRPADMASVLAVQDELAVGIAERLALPNGAIAVAGERQAGARPATMLAYDCVQRAFLFRRVSDYATSLPAVLCCLEEAVALEPRYANAWAMLSFVHMDGGRLGLVEPAAVPRAFAASRVAAERAVAVAPSNILSLQALANVRYNDGAYVEAERIQRQAIALSPHNPDSLAQLGWRLVARGRVDEAVDLLREAIERSLRSPTWYHQSLALAYFFRDEPGPAYDEAVLGQGFCCGLGSATLAIAAANLGHPEQARAALADALAQSALLGSDPRAFWRVWHVEEHMIDRLVAGLRKAGLVVTAAG